MSNKLTYYYIYKTTCIITNRYYIGMHVTRNLDDGYQGSGKRIKRSIKKYGRENHKVEILDFLPNRELLIQRETELVNENLIQDSLCMNLHPGGIGGSFSGERNGMFGKKHKPGFWEKIHAAKTEKLKDLNVKKQLYERRTATIIERYGKGENWWLGKSHKDETKSKIGLANSERQKGERNSQFGKCWIYNERLRENKKIQQNDLHSYLDQGWLKGRKINF